MDQNNEKIDSDNRYNVNFFKPSTPFLKENVRAIVLCLVVWGVSVFGFQIILKTIEKPVFEKGHLVYQRVYPKLTQKTATVSEKKEIAVIYLQLMAKSIPLRNNESLKAVFTATIEDILPITEKAKLTQVAEKVQHDKSVDTAFIASALGVENNTPLRVIIPYALVSLAGQQGFLVHDEIPTIMDRYLVHNQSFLTDTVFMGFPLHYFYTAIVLLLLFLIICLIYCRFIDRLMKKYEMESPIE